MLDTMLKLSFLSLTAFLNKQGKILYKKVSGLDREMSEGNRRLPLQGLIGIAALS